MSVILGVVGVLPPNPVIASGGLSLFVKRDKDPKTFGLILI